MDSISEVTHLEKFIGLLKNLSLIIVIPVLFLLSDEYENLKTVMVLVVAILFLLEGFILFSKQKTNSLIDFGVGLFLIAMIIFI